MIGQVHPKNSLFLRIDCGTASDDEGHVYELSTGLGGGLYVKSRVTGRIWSLGWQEAVRLAVEAGIDEEDAA